MSYLQKDDAETWFNDMHSLPHKHEIRPQVFYKLHDVTASIKIL